MTPEEAALEAGYALASDDAAAWCEAHDFPAVADALWRKRHRGASSPGWRDRMAAERDAAKAKFDAEASKLRESIDALSEFLPDRDAAREADK